MSAPRVVAALLAMMLGAALISVLPGAVRASADPGNGAATDSAMTKSGTGEFSKLQVKVSQTKNLTNQVITVTWTGGAPTQGSFSTNYLQIMQCWGDDPGPDRTQCQFGADGPNLGSLGTYGSNTTRGLSVVSDPKENLTLPPPPQVGYVPFWPVGRDKPIGAATSNSNDFYDSQSTNEIPLAMTRPDGTGEVFFEVQTLREASGLGCGEQLTAGATTGRKCWLVVVPRGSTDADGSPKDGSPNPTLGVLLSSPLSQSNWENRIFFPLEFVPVGNACPIGSAERRVVGHELATDAFGRWQPALCASGGANFSYTQLADDVARNLVVDGSSPGLTLVTDPIPPDQVADRPRVYAPVGLSGLALAFNMIHEADPLARPDKHLLDGQRFLSMNLTPRLVAKLLTQSYTAAVAGFQQNLVPDYLKKNPPYLTSDPEFLELNPDYRDFRFSPQPPDALVQLGGSDLTSLLWTWVKADPDASAFLAGTADKYGMVVNPNNKGLTLPTATFPRNDQTCVNAGIGDSCTLDVHPFTNDMHEAGRSAARGDSLARYPARDQNNRVVPAKGPRVGTGLIAVVDTATAARYNLPTASLRNAAGQFVAPTTTGLLASEAAMKLSGVPGVLASDPEATDPAAYPLTALSYAVTTPSTLDAAAGKDYAALLRYAVGPGQQPGTAPGQLPFGMAPLPDGLRAQTAAAATVIEDQAGKSPSSSATPTPPPGSAPEPTAAAGDTASSTGGSVATTPPSASTTTTNPGGGVYPPTADQATPGPATKAPDVAQRPIAVGRTPALPAPAWVGVLLLAILICGGLAATSSPVLRSLALRQLGAALLRRARKGVRPTGR